ncbi:MAG: hypothetical protein E6G34_10315 [Actinobacteria bacterium]|nr:MAG: hypothetical protein E6G34_10315 [Actinomycetota bacterium]
MAEAGLFIGWGEPVTGREAKGLEVFAEALAYYGKAEQDGRIESQETVLLGPHGGDLGGFTLVRGSEAQIAALRAEDEFERIVTRAALVVQNVGVVDAAVGDGVQDAIGVYQAAVADLT